MMKNSLKIIFMGTPEFAIPSLIEFAKYHHVLCVFTQPPKPFGRGMNLKKTPIHIQAERLNLKVYSPSSLTEKKIKPLLTQYAPDMLIVVAYGIILPKSILKIPKLGAINGHASLLPKWRGSAPIQRAIEAGDTETGCSIMLMDSGLDTGPILLQKKLNILKEDDSISIHKKLSNITSKCLLEASERFLKGKIKLTKQNNSKASYAKKLRKEEGQIKWELSSNQIYNKMRAFKPYPGIFTKYKSEKLKIISGKPLNRNHEFKPGTVLTTKNELLIACGENSVFIVQSIQKEGKKILNSKEFLRGSVINSGAIFD